MTRDPLNPSAAPVAALTNAQVSVASPSGSRWTILHEGAVLKNQRLVRLLGRGGMGEVWETENTHIKSLRSALKVVRPELAEEPSFKARFLFEATTLAGLAHDNILAVRDFAIDDVTGIPFLLTELLEGEDLATRLQRAMTANLGGLPQLEVCNLIAQAADGAAHAHAQQVIHRDLKPLNLFLTKRGVVKLLDFGIARAAGSQLTKTSVGLPGSPGYYAPEFVDGASASPASDVYALGVSLFELVAGRLPFLGGGDTDEQRATTTMLQHATKPPPNLRVLRSGLSEPFVALVERALAKTPAERPTMAELARALRGLTGQPPIAVAPAAPLVMPDATVRDVAAPAAPLATTNFAIAAPGQAPTKPASAELSSTRFAIAAVAPRAAALPPPDVVVEPRPPMRRAHIALAGGAVVVGIGLAFVLLDAMRGSSEQDEPVLVDEGAAERAADDAKRLAGFAQFTGSPSVRIGKDGDRGPLDREPRYVRLAPFALQKFEVSQAELAQLGNSVACTTCWDHSCEALQGSLSPCPTPTFLESGADDFPAVNVSPEQANAFCAWWTPGGRLPSEDEWELGARASGTALFPWGNDKRPECLPGSLEPARASSANCDGAQGLTHVVGNVWEWTSTPMRSAEDGALLPGVFVIRGGSFKSGVVDANARSAANAGDATTGFRCAVSL